MTLIPVAVELDVFIKNRLSILIIAASLSNKNPNNPKSNYHHSLTLSVATITPDTENLYTMKNDHVITCALAHLREPAVGVSWTTNTKTNNVYSPQDGTHSSTTFEQKSTLALSSVQLTALKAVSNTVTFTCQVTVGETSISATQTINLFTPSEYF